MTFTFFSTADRVLFVRSDAEQADHNHQEMSLHALFPYDPGKVVQQGQRVGFEDSLGVFQVFEVTKVKTYEPDHYQEVTAEHIVISELRDEMYAGGDLMNKTPQQALTAILTGTLWSVGTVTATNSSSVKLSFGYVWDDVRSIEQNWNVYITPRVTVDAGGITGRYLDIKPAEGTWRGLRLSLDKNMEDAAVTWDETRLKTALYGYGKSQENGSPLTFAGVTWAATAEHPAKPNGQKYLEDPDATAAYGRNGRPRYGYYQNGDVDDANKLLQLTWEALKSCNVPDVTVEGTALDLTRLGAPDVPIRLHDTALVEIRPTGVLLHKEIVQYNENLLEPGQSRVTIGVYIPNIVYIARETAAGRGGGGGSGKSQTNEEYKLKEFETNIGWNDYQISLKAWQRDLDKTDENLLLAYAAIGISSSQIQSIVTGSGVQLDPDTGNIVTDANGLPVFAAGSSQMWSNITQNSTKIALVVSDNNAIKAASIVAAINSAGSSVTINADKIYLNGHTLVTEISGIEADFTNLTTGRSTATQLKATYLEAASTFNVNGTGYRANSLTGGSMTFGTILGANNVGIDIGHSHTLTSSVSGGSVTIRLGSMNSASQQSITFNIADTEFYQQAVSAAYNNGWKGAANSISWPNSSTDQQIYITYPNTSIGTSQKAYFLTQASSWSNGKKNVYLRQNSTTGLVVGRSVVSMPTSVSWNIYNYAGITLGETIHVGATIGGKLYETDAVI